MSIQHTSSPEAGKDHPRNWNEFLDWLGTEEACLGYLGKRRWPDGFVSPVPQVRYQPSALPLTMQHVCNTIAA